ncbi:MAG: DUF3108 domain-containing protein [Burkholderiaceae bacterium]
MLSPPSPSSSARPPWRRLGLLALVVAAAHALLLAPALVRRAAPGTAVAPGRVPTLLTRALPLAVARAEAPEAPSHKQTATETPATARPTQPRPVARTPATPLRPAPQARRARMPVAAPTEHAAVARNADPLATVAVAGAAAAAGDDAPRAVTVVAAASPVKPVGSEASATDAATSSAGVATERPAPAASAAPPPAAASHADAPARVAPSAQLVYQVSGHARGIPYSASATLDWQQDGSRYAAQWSFAGPLGLTRQQISAGAITPHGLAPERFGERSRSERAAHFERGRGRIVFSSNTPEAELAAGAQDRLSVTLQLGALIAAAPARYPPGTHIVLQVAGARDASAWTFQVLGDETLQLAGQPMPCVKLERQPDEPYGQRIELWLARERHFLPVRLRITQGNGDVADQRLAEPPGAN